jgi:hypothetical protein
MAYYRINLSAQIISVLHMVQILTGCDPNKGLERYRYSNLLNTSNRALISYCRERQQEGQFSTLILLANKWLRFAFARVAPRVVAYELVLVTLLTGMRSNAFVRRCMLLLIYHAVCNWYQGFGAAYHLPVTCRRINTHLPDYTVPKQNTTSSWQYRPYPRGLAIQEQNKRPHYELSGQFY